MWKWVLVRFLFFSSQEWIQELGFGFVVRWKMVQARFSSRSRVMVLGWQERAIRWIGLSQGSKCSRAKVMVCLSLKLGAITRKIIR
jgi:hypothetical protein